MNDNEQFPKDSEDDVRRQHIVSQSLPALARSIDEELIDISGERHAFLLVVMTGYCPQYISTGARPDMIKALEDLLQRFKDGTTGPPAHVKTH